MNEAKVMTGPARGTKEWRLGPEGAGRVLYEGDRFVGLTDRPDDASAICAAMNRALAYDEVATHAASVAAECAKLREDDEQLRREKSELGNALEAVAEAVGAVHHVSMGPSFPGSPAEVLDAVEQLAKDHYELLKTCCTRKALEFALVERDEARDLAEHRADSARMAQAAFDAAHLRALAVEKERDELRRDLAEERRAAETLYDGKDAALAKQLRGDVERLTRDLRAAKNEIARLNGQTRSAEQQAYERANNDPYVPGPPSGAEEPLIGRTYRHFKGTLYKVVALGKLEADSTPVVVYEGDGNTWVRPVASFLEMVRGKPRFAPADVYLTPNDAKPCFWCGTHGKRQWGTCRREHAEICDACVERLYKAQTRGAPGVDDRETTGWLVFTDEYRGGTICRRREEAVETLRAWRRVYSEKTHRLIRLTRKAKGGGA